MDKLNIGNIPAIIWGKPSDRVYIHVHGKMSRKEYAEEFAAIAESKGCQTVSFDLPDHGERGGRGERCDIWSGMRDLAVIRDYVFARWGEVSLFACSLGAYFSLNTYCTDDFKKCLFQSPILDMEYLIGQMMTWFDITEERLAAEREIDTPVDLMTWDYYQYVKAHPLKIWDIPTAILYGGKDNLQSRQVVEGFAEKHNCRLTVSESSEHPFMEQADFAIVHNWLDENI